MNPTQRQWFERLQEDPLHRIHRKQHLIRKQIHEAALYGKGFTPAVYFFAELLERYTVLQPGDILR